MNITICAGCGTHSNERIKQPCCPDSRYVDILQYMDEYGSSNDKLREIRNTVLWRFNKMIADVFWDKSDLDESNISLDEEINLCVFDGEFDVSFAADLKLYVRRMLEGIRDREELVINRLIKL